MFDCFLSLFYLLKNRYLARPARLSIIYRSAYQALEPISLRQINVMVREYRLPGKGALSFVFDFKIQKPNSVTVLDCTP
jgi:hypothetical protein